MSDCMTNTITMTNEWAKEKEELKAIDIVQRHAVSISNDDCIRLVTAITQALLDAAKVPDQVREALERLTECTKGRGKLANCGNWQFSISGKDWDFANEALALLDSKAADKG